MVDSIAARSLAVHLLATALLDARGPTVREQCFIPTRVRFDRCPMRDVLFSILGYWKLLHANLVIIAHAPTDIQVRQLTLVRNAMGSLRVAPSTRTTLASTDRLRGPSSVGQILQLL